MRTVTDDESKRSLHLVTKSQFLREEGVVYVLVPLGELLAHQSRSLRKFVKSSPIFSDIMPCELSGKLLPKRDIQHVIDFVSGSILSNLSHYKMNPIKHAELRQVYELLRKGFIR